MKSILFPPLAAGAILFASAIAIPAHANPANTTIHPQPDGSRIIVERIAGIIEIPDPPEPVVRPAEPPQPPEHIVRAAEQWQAWREANPFIQAAATVYRLTDGRRITHVSHWSVNNRPPVSFWSAADFSLLAHSGEMITPQGVHYGLLLMHSARDVENEQAIPAARRIESFPQGPAGWQMDENSGPADAATLAAIQAVHDFYESNQASLKAAYEKLEAERAARRAELEANPPQPRDIHLRVGRLSREQAADWHRHASQKSGGTE